MVHSVAIGVPIVHGVGEDGFVFAVAAPDPVSPLSVFLSELQGLRGRSGSG